jgi:CRP/FNR family transcriptional regulator
MSQWNGEVVGDEGLWMRDLLADSSLGAERLELSAGSVLFGPPGAANHIFRIERGEIRTYQVGPDESSRLVEILGPGDWCGMGALAHAPIYICRGVVVTDAVVWQVPVESLRAAWLRHPALAAELIDQLASKLLAAQEVSGRLVFDDCNSRLIKTLLHFSRTAAAVPAKEGGVELRITHQQLAQAVGAARETVSLGLTQLRQRNLLRTGRNRLFFDPEVLRTVCESEMEGGEKRDVAPHA